MTRRGLFSAIGAAFLGRPSKKFLGKGTLESIESISRVLGYRAGISIDLMCRNLIESTPFSIKKITGQIIELS